MNKGNKVMLGEVPRLCLLVLVAVAPAASGAGAACERGRSYWDRERGACAPCTFCDSNLGHVVGRPCDLYRDTICRPLRDLRIGLADYEYEVYDDTDAEQVSDSDVTWDLELIALVIAASGCAIFFVVVLYLTVHHSKQWKALKQALRTDVQDLSAKLKLMEAGETPAEPAAPADHHIYCNINVAKDALLGPATNKKGLGNVYTQEKHPS